MSKDQQKENIQTNKRQRWKHGLLYCLPLSDGAAVLGKVLNDLSNVVYREVYESPVALKANIIKAAEREPLLFNGLAHFVIKQGFFEVVGHEAVTEEELLAIPPEFHMMTAHPENCQILFPGTGVDRKALPSECVGMNYLFSWEVPGYVRLIEDTLAGRVNEHYARIYKDLEKGIAIERERQMKVPWEGWNHPR